MKMVKIAAFVILTLIVIGLIILFIRNGYQILPPSRDYRDDILIAMQNIK